MRVGFMARSVRPGATGVGRYAANLVASLAEVMPPHSLAVFLTRDAPRRWQAPMREIRAPFPTPNEYARAFWEQTVVPATVTALGLDVYHSPNYILPLGLTCPAVVTIHDLTFRQRAVHRMTSHLYLSVMTGLALRQAAAIVAVSDHTRRAIERQYPRTAGRVGVIYEGVDPALEPPSPAALAEFRERLGLTRPYVLFVGSQEPRKNLPRLVRAFERAMAETGLPHRLVLVGPRGWKTDPLETAIATSPLRDRIDRVGYVPDSDLACWYAAADLFVYPSLDEGFGLPPLEAMACGAPVLTSNVSALPEVVGDAALTVDPRDTAALATAMERALTEPTLADRLREAGPRRAHQFSWLDTALAYQTVYHHAATGDRHAGRSVSPLGLSERRR
jgi:glycosyltransferase involved in cell wall biosynthesis